MGRRHSGRASESGGFTLLELVIAVTLTTMVMVMIYSALNMALGIWGRERHHPPGAVWHYAALLRDQWAGFLPAKVKIEDKTESLLEINGHDMVFATAASVAGLHGGAPVMVRYVFDPEKRVLYYSEAPLMPGKEDYTENFLKMTPVVEGGEGAGESSDGLEDPKWYSAPVYDLAFSYELEDTDDGASGVTVDWREDPMVLHRVTLHFKENEGDPEERVLFFPTFLDFRALKESK